MEIFILSTICGSIAYTMTEAGVFRKYREVTKNINPWLGELTSCGYCTGHWISFFLVFIYRPRIVHSDFILLDYFLTAIFISWFSGLWWRFMVCVGTSIACMKLDKKCKERELLLDRTTDTHPE